MIPKGASSTGAASLDNGKNFHTLDREDEVSNRLINLSLQISSGILPRQLFHPSFSLDAY